MHVDLMRRTVPVMYPSHSVGLVVWDGGEDDTVKRIQVGQYCGSEVLCAVSDQPGPPMTVC